MLWASLAPDTELDVGTSRESGGSTYIKVFLGGCDGDSAQGLLVFLVNHLVPIHPLSLMQPKADKVQWAFQNLCCGE